MYLVFCVRASYRINIAWLIRPWYLVQNYLAWSWFSRKNLQDNLCNKVWISLNRWKTTGLLIYQTKYSIIYHIVQTAHISDIWLLHKWILKTFNFSSFLIGTFVRLKNMVPNIILSSSLRALQINLGTTCVWDLSNLQCKL